MAALQATSDLVVVVALIVDLHYELLFLKNRRLLAQNLALLLKNLYQAWTTSIFNRLW
jgi:hypothetical protein